MPRPQQVGTPLSTTHGSAGFSLHREDTEPLRTYLQRISTESLMTKHADTPIVDNSRDRKSREDVSASRHRKTKKMRRWSRKPKVVDERPQDERPRNDRPQELPRAQGLFYHSPVGARGVSYDPPIGARGVSSEGKMDDASNR